MKHNILIAMIIFGCAVRIMAQSQDDHSVVLQKCIDLKELQQYYPRTEDGKFKQLYILQHGEPFPANIKVSKNGKKPLFISKQEAHANGHEYFIFREFKVTNETARVEFLYQFNNADNTSSSFVATLDLSMANNIWTITNCNIELR